MVPDLERCSRALHLFVAVAINVGGRRSAVEVAYPNLSGPLVPAGYLVVETVAHLVIDLVAIGSDLPAVDLSVRAAADYPSEGYPTAER